MVLTAWLVTSFCAVSKLCIGGEEPPVEFWVTDGKGAACSVTNSADALAIPSCWRLARTDAAEAIVTEHS